MTENERGVIAESYDELQGVAVLRDARSAPLPLASWDSSVRAILQSVEVALLNVADLLERAARDLDSNRPVEAAAKLAWVRGFHTVLVQLSLCPLQLHLGSVPDGPDAPTLQLADSPALQSFLDALRHFDGEVLRAGDTGTLALESTLATGALGDPSYTVLHLARIADHESSVWEENLSSVPVEVAPTSYADFIAADILREAVHGLTLRGDTFFTQFRGLHQIPETLGAEINDHLAAAIRHLRGAEARRAIEHLEAARLLAEVMVACVAPMVDSLATSDYHRIRENLGLTSGSQSVCLRYELFTDLYQQLWDALVTLLVGRPPSDCDDETVDEAIRRARARRFDDPAAADADLVVGLCLTLRALIFHWRAEHLHLPRNNLGGEETRSLTGSHDAVRTVRNLRTTALARDPAKPLARSRGLAGAVEAPAAAVSSYLQSDASLDSHLLRATGHLTQRTFTDVQERTGFFSHRCAFTPPPPRQA
jgi:hypothetical protein